jgi:hypothetical protein
MFTLPAIHPKIAGGAVGGYLAIIVLYALHQYVGFNPPAEVGQAITGLILLAVGAASPNPDVLPAVPLAPVQPPAPPAPAPVPPAPAPPGV